jgi:hypothetical protein
LPLPPNSEAAGGAPFVSLSEIVSLPSRPDTVIRLVFATVVYRPGLTPHRR